MPAPGHTRCMTECMLRTQTYDRWRFLRWRTAVGDSRPTRPAAGAGRGLTSANSPVRSSSVWFQTLVLLLALVAPATQAQVVFVANGTNSVNGTSLTLQVPAAATANDVLVAIISLRGGAGQTINTPAGWNLQRRDNNGNDLAQAVYWRVAQAGDAGASVTWNGWNSVRAVGAILVYSGADVSLSTPIDVSGGQLGNSTSITAPSVNSTTANPLLVLAFGQAAGSRSITSPAGASARVNSLQTGSTSNGVTMSVADAMFLGVGPTPVFTAASDLSGNNLGQVIAIRPGAVGSSATRAFYKMEEAAWTGAAGEVTDASGNANHATAIGAAQTTAFGRVCRGALIPLNTNNGQRFGIDSGIDINSVGNRGTISFWYQAAANWNSGAARQLFDASALVPPAGKFFFAAVQGNGVLRFALEDENDTAYQVDSPPQIIAAGTWVHIAVTWQLLSAPNNRLRVYINGTLAGEVASAQQTLAADLGNLIVGDSSSNYYSNGSTPNSANGVIDEVRVYAFEQTAAAIQADMSAPNPCRLIAEYRLDELSWTGVAGEVQDSSGNGLHGVAVGGALPAPARVCNGAQLNLPPAMQTAYIEVADNPLLDISNTLTMTAWVNPAAYPASDLMTIVSKGSNWKLHLTPSGQVNWWWNTGSAQLFTGPGAVPLNSWTHVAITFQQGRQTIFINGAPAASGTDASALITNNLPLQIGDDQGFGGGSRRFRGLIDELQIHSRLMSQADIVTIMNTTHPCPSSVDHYHVQNVATAINCQPENITITAHDVAHQPVSAAARTIVVTAARVAGAAGNHGDFARVVGTGVLDNAIADDGVATYTFGTAETAVTLGYRNTWVQTINISVTDGSASDISGSASADVGYDQSMSFTASGLRFVDATDNALPNQVAGVSAGPFYLQAIATAGCASPGPCTGACTVPGAFAAGSSVNMQLAFRCDDPTTCQPGQQVSITNNGTSAIAANPAAGVSAWTSKSMLFGANGMAAFGLVYPDVGAVSLHARYNLPLEDGSASTNFMQGSSNSFVVSPYSFVVETASPNEIKRTADGFVNPAAVSATGPVFIRAGDDFSATVTAINFAGAATPNFGREQAPETVRLTANLVAGLGLTNNPPLANAAAFGAFSGGRASGTTFSWGEVGIITLTPRVGDGNYLGAGDVVGGASSNVGRFVPFDFSVTRNVPLFDPGCSVAGKDAFSYIGEPFLYQTAPVITVNARNRAGVTTQNYSANFFRISAATLTGKAYSAAAGALDTSGLAASDPLIRYSGDGFPSAPPPGTATLTFSAGTGLKFNRSTPVPVFDADIALAINVADLDATSVALIDGVAGTNPVRFGQASPGNGILFAGTTVTPGKTPREMRFGRLRMENLIGTSRLPLPLRLSTQYYTANGFVRNSDDACTTFNASDMAMAFVGGTNLVACETAPLPTGVVTLTDGLLSGVSLAAPGSGNDGSVDLELNLAAPGGSTCTSVGGGTIPATFTGLDYLQGNWGGSAAWDQDPRVRATFGVYKKAPEFLFLQENY